MPLKDLRSNLDIQHVFNVQDDNNATISTPFFFVGNAESITILLSVGKVTGGETVTITGIDESLDISGTPFNAVDTDMIIGDLTKTVINDSTFAAQVSRIGLFAVKPFIRVNLAQSGAPLNDVMVSFIKEPVVIPAINPED